MKTKKQTVVLYGSKADREIKQKAKTLTRAGRKVKVEPPPADTHASGVGFEGDQGSSMGMGY